MREQLAFWDRYRASTALLLLPPLQCYLAYKCNDSWMCFQSLKSRSLPHWPKGWHHTIQASLFGLSCTNLRISVLFLYKLIENWVSSCSHIMEIGDILSLWDLMQHTSQGGENPLNLPSDCLALKHFTHWVLFSKWIDKARSEAQLCPEGTPCVKGTEGRHCHLHVGPL